MTGSKSFRKKKTLKVFAKIVLYAVSSVFMILSIVSAAGLFGDVVDGTAFSVPIFLRCVLYAAASYLSAMAAQF